MSTAHKTPDVKVACGTCRACCYGQHVVLQPEDNPRLYQTQPSVFGLELIKREDGACVYLGEHGCEIYPIRPVLCRTFTCVGMYARMDETVRDLTALIDPVTRAGQHRFRSLVDWKKS